MTLRWLCDDFAMTLRWLWGPCFGLWILNKFENFWNKFQNLRNKHDFHDFQNNLHNFTLFGTSFKLFHRFSERYDDKYHFLCIISEIIRNFQKCSNTRVSGRHHNIICKSFFVSRSFFVSQARITFRTSRHAAHAELEAVIAEHDDRILATRGHTFQLQCDCTCTDECVYICVCVYIYIMRISYV